MHTKYTIKTSTFTFQFLRLLLVSWYKFREMTAHRSLEDVFVRQSGLDILQVLEALKDGL